MRRVGIGRRARGEALPWILGHQSLRSPAQTHASWSSMTIPNFALRSDGCYVRGSESQLFASIAGYLRSGPLDCRISRIRTTRLSNLPGSRCETARCEAHRSASLACGSRQLEDGEVGCAAGPGCYGDGDRSGTSSSLSAMRPSSASNAILIFRMMLLRFAVARSR